MIGALALALVVSAAPVKVAVPGFSVVGLEPAVVDAWADRFVTLLGRDGALKLITQRDIAQVLGLERQKQLLGCSETQTSCLAELAGALGVDAILSVSLAKSGTTFTATLRVLKASDGSQLAAATERLRNEDALQDWLDEQAPLLTARVVEVLGTQEKPGPGLSPVVRWVPAMAGAGLAIGGGVLFGLSRGSAERLRSGTFDSTTTAASVASTGRTLEGAGVGLMIAGGVAMAASAVWVLLAPATEVHVAVTPMPSGATAMLVGTF